MNSLWRANNFRQQAGVLPVELLADASLCLQAAAEIAAPEILS